VSRQDVCPYTRPSVWTAVSAKLRSIRSSIADQALTIPWLAPTYATLLKDAKAVSVPATTLLQLQAVEEPPICAVHQVPLARVQGRTGPFWSCHEKMSTGQWCPYKPRR
jgi:hypothetical protein